MKKYHPSSRLFLLALAVAAGIATAHAEDNDALLNALVRKKILTTKEAESIRADVIKEEAGGSTEKLRLSNSISELTLYGDIRLRYQYDNADLKLEDRPKASTVGSPDLAAFDKRTQQSRFRFRLRLNADFKLTDNFFGGVQLQTASTPDGGNQTFGSAYNNYSIFISRAYFGWIPLDGITLIGGKQPNPFYTTDLVWDADINPDGFTEQIEIHKLLGATGRDQTVGYSKDGKAVVTTSSESPWQLTLNLGQLIYQDNPENFWGNDNNHDVWQFVQQAVFSYKFTPGVKFTIAPGYEVWTPGNTGSGGAAVGFTSTRDLSIITAPGDVSFKVFGLKTKVLWDFAYNTDGGKRFHDVLGVNHYDKGAKTTYASALHPADATLPASTDKAGGDYEPHSATDNLAFLVGFQVGENKKKGDWSILANYRQSGVASLDPNENDSDFALSYLNTRGFKVGVAYNFTDFCVGAVTFYDAWQLRGDITQGIISASPGGWSSANAATGPTGAKLAAASNVQVMQVDLSVKF
jgi:hypothetical protein